MPKPNVAPSTVPATFLTRCSSPAPYAWPINTLLPLAMPIKNENSKKMIGKTAETAAKAFTPSMRPKKMLLNVCEADCRMLLSIKGIKNTKKSCHMGREASKMLTPGRRSA